MGLSLRGQSSGAIDINAPNAAGNNTITLPGSNGAANQFYKNSGTAGTLTHSSMIEDSSGQIGIGTDSPGTLLELKGQSSKEATVTFNRQPVQSTNDGVIGELMFENATDSVALLSVKRESAADDAYFQFATQATSGGLTEKLRITGDGNFGFGTNAPSQTSSGRTVLSINGTANSLLNFSHGGTLTGFIYGANDEFRFESNDTKPLIFRTAGGTALTIDTNAKLILPTGSPGIQFGSSDTGTNITSQTLDDYEEGTWSPTFGASTSAPTCTYSPTPVGNYTKIGRLVHVSCKIDATGRSGGSGAWLIAGLPFTINDTTGAGGSPSMSNMNVTDGGVNIATEYQNGGTSFYAGLVTRDNASWSNLSISAVPNGNCNYRVEFSYYTDS